MPLLAQPNTVVAPSMVATQNVAFGAGTLRNPNFRIQEVYGSQHFPTQGMIITELRFRPDSYYGQAFTATVSNIQFNLSTARVNPDGMSPTFASNVGLDDTVVFHGALSISSQFTGAAGEPKAFDIAVRLTTPFIYDPAAGNLLLDIRNYTGATGASLLAGEYLGEDAASRLFGSLPSVNGSPDTGIDALQLVYIPTNHPTPLRLTRGPYLQSGTTTNIIVRWRTQVPSDSRVQFGLSPASLPWEVVEAAAASDHTVTLTNLAPDTKYFYAIGSSTTNLAGGPDYFFRTAPLTGKPTRIWAIGDCGTITQLGYVGQPKVRDAYKTYAGGRYTDVWLLLGDNAYLSGLDSEYQTAVFDMYPQQLRCTTMWSTIGNHDVGGDYFDIFTLPKNGEGGGIASGTESYYSFDYGNIHFICLDAEVSIRTNGSPMLMWLEQDLAANTRDWLIAYWHEPPYSKGSHNSDAFAGADLKLTEMRENSVPLLESYGVDLVLCGHSHSYERTCLLNGHYGRSDTLLPLMTLDSGSGREGDSGAYLKPTTGLAANQGAVYVVAGSSGWVTPGVLNHPAMFADPAWGGMRGLNQLGSMVIDIDGNRLDARFLRETGAIDDHFTIIKGAGPAPFRLATLSFANGNATAQWKSTASRRYRLERTASLDSPVWTPASPVVTATGATTQWRGPVAPQTDGDFFRVADLGP